MKLLRGWLGETKTTFRLWLWLDGKTYRRFHDIIIPSKNGTTQIDHLLISQYGLFIIETKNYKGWIFGSENDLKWTKTLYGKKYQFQNPLRQTYRQKKVLCEFLRLDESIVHMVVYFVGDCKFKTPLPANVMKSGLSRYLKRFKIEVLTSEEVNSITDAIKQHLSHSKISRRGHVRSLRNRHKSTTICPNCGSNLVQRIAKKGANAGSKFLGCESYPRCRFARDIKPHSKSFLSWLFK